MKRDYVRERCREETELTVVCHSDMFDSIPRYLACGCADLDSFPIIIYEVTIKPHFRCVCTRIFVIFSLNVFNVLTVSSIISMYFPKNYNSITSVESQNVKIVCFLHQCFAHGFLCVLFNYLLS